MTKCTIWDRYGRRPSRYWIFQADPEHRDLAERLKPGETRVVISIKDSSARVTLQACHKNL